MDGFQTTKVIRAMFEESVRPTIISVTASESPEESMKCLSLGMGTSHSVFAVSYMTDGNNSTLHGQTIDDFRIVHSLEQV